MAAKSYQQALRELRELEADPSKARHNGDTVEHRLERVRRWRDAMRAVGACKKCGERLDGKSGTARLARARGIGTTCWETKTTADERDRVSAWVEKHRDVLMEEPE